jgi:AcrR family transcriptional regulator
LDASTSRDVPGSAVYAVAMVTDRDLVTVPLRSDAARNRAAILVASRSLFGERGLDAPLDQIARMAGVGNATLYRHFPTRCALVAAVFAETLGDVVAAAREALAQPDPWVGFTSYVTFLCRLQATDRGLADLLTTTITGAADLEELRARAYVDFGCIVKRAKKSGGLRSDFQPEDLVLILMANAGLIHRTAATVPDAWSRLLRCTLAGLRAQSDTTLGPAVGEASVRRAMADQARLFGVH